MGPELASDRRYVPALVLYSHSLTHSLTHQLMVDDSTYTSGTGTGSGSGVTGTSSEYTSSTATSTLKPQRSDKRQLATSSSTSLKSKSQNKLSASSVKAKHVSSSGAAVGATENSSMGAKIKQNSNGLVPIRKKKQMRDFSEADKPAPLLTKTESTMSNKSGKSSRSLIKKGVSLGSGAGSPGIKKSTSVISSSKKRLSPSLKRGSSTYSEGMDSRDSKGSTFHDESDLTNNTALFEKNLAVYRKFRVAVRETEDLIQNHEDRALKRVQERVMKETLESKIEVESRILKEESLSIKQSFIQEADVAKEDQEQLRALKLYHKMHVQRLLPLWFRSLNDCTSCIASNGHSDKLQWRSKSRKLLLVALQEMEDDDSSDIVRAKVRYLALSINARKAQQVLNILKLIRDEYIRHKEGNSELGHHSSELRRVNNLLNPDKPCPLQRGQWSTDLESSVSNVKQKHERSLINQSANGGLGSSVLSIDDEFTLMSADEETYTFDKDGLQSPSIDEGVHNSYDFSRMSPVELQNEEPSKQMFSRNLNSKNSFMLSTGSTPVDPHNNTDIMRLLRETACQGLLQESWKVFSHFYGEYINNVKDRVFVHMNLKCVPTLETFKLLIMAFKNSDSNQFDDLSTILILMKRANVEPDLETFNMILRSCERRGAWRRALKILKVQLFVHYFIRIIYTLNSFSLFLFTVENGN